MWIYLISLSPISLVLFYLGCCSELSEPLEHISELCHCWRRSCTALYDQGTRIGRCRSAAVTVPQRQRKLGDRGGRQKAGGIERGPLKVCFTSNKSISCLASSLTTSVICGAFVRQTQSAEMQEVLLFSCSIIESRWSSAAWTKKGFSYEDAMQYFPSVLVFIVSALWVLPVVLSRVWPVIMSRGSSSILTAWPVWTASLDIDREKWYPCEYYWLLIILAFYVCLMPVSYVCLCLDWWPWSCILHESVQWCGEQMFTNAPCEATQLQREWGRRVC